MTDLANSADSQAVSAERIEYERRLGTVRELMAAEGFDAIVSGDNGAFVMPTGNVRYLTNFALGTLGAEMNGMAVVMALEGEPWLIVPQGALGGLAAWARSSAWTSRVLSTPVLGWPPREDLLSDVVRALEESGVAGGRIGLCAPFPHSDELQGRLPGATVESCAVVDGRGTPRDILERARRVKSEWEIARLREAQRYADLGLEAFMDAVKPGVRNSHAIARGEFAARNAGADEAFILMNSGMNPWVWWFLQGNRRFSEGDFVTLEMNARVDGYVSQLCRGGMLGTPDDLHRRLVATSALALQAMEERLAPGITGDELWAVGNDVIAKAGFTTWGRLAHGMGLSMAEGFDALPGDDNVVEENFCVEIHASVMDPDTKATAIIGDQYLVRAGGAALMSEHRLPADFGPPSLA